MPDLLSSLNPITSIISAVGDLIGKYVLSPEDKAKAMQTVLQIQSDATLKLAQLDQQFADSQASVITAEVKSDSWLARNWRPILMLTFTYIIAHNYVLLPLFHLAPVAIPPDMWSLLKLGIGGYIGARTVEKGVAIVANNIGGGK